MSLYVISIFENEIVRSAISAVLFVLVLSLPWIARALYVVRNTKRVVRQRIETLNATLTEVDQKLLIATDVATSHYRIMTQASELSLFAVRQELLRLIAIRDEAQSLLNNGKYYQLKSAEHLLRTTKSSPEVGIALRRFFRPTVEIKEHSEFASLKRLMTFTLMHVRFEANVNASEAWN